jgi:hypothetical protein
VEPAGRGEEKMVSGGLGEKNQSREGGRCLVRDKFRLFLCFFFFFKLSFLLNMLETSIYR